MLAGLAVHVWSVHELNQAGILELKAKNLTVFGPKMNQTARHTAWFLRHRYRDGCRNRSAAVKLIGTFGA